VPLYRVLMKIPLPGLDVALSVATYQVASIAGLIIKFVSIGWRIIKKWFRAAGYYAGRIREKSRSAE